MTRITKNNHYGNKQYSKRLRTILLNPSTKYDYNLHDIDSKGRVIINIINDYNISYMTMRNNIPIEVKDLPEIIDASINNILIDL